MTISKPTTFPINTNPNRIAWRDEDSVIFITREEESAMGNRRFVQISMSEEDEEEPQRPLEESSPRRKRLKRIKLPEDEVEPKWTC